MGIPTICHNEVRDITAHFVSEVCYNVGTELILQTITDERLYATALPAQRMELMCLLRHKASLGK